MIRARSRIFFLTFSICWGFFIAFGAYCIFSRPNQFASERWRENDALVRQFTTVSLVLTVLLGLLGAGLLIFEYMIRQGWEPAFMEVYRPGCTILASETLPGGKSNVVVRMQNGEVQTFEADEEETKEIQVGSITHLWVIGQYVSRLKLISPTAPPATLTLWEFNLIKPNSRPMLAWTNIIFSTALSGYMTAYGLVVAFGQSLILAPMTTDLYEGTDVTIIGFLVALAGIGFFGFTAFQWYRGWDESFWEDLSNSQDRIGPDWS